MSVLVIVAAAFTVNMRLELMTAENALRSTKTIYLAEAGFNKAIKDITEDAKSEFTDDLNDSWSNIPPDNTLLTNRGTYQVQVFDCQRMVNINNANINL